MDYFIKLAAADQRGRDRTGDIHDLSCNNGQPNRRGQTDRFVQAGLRVSQSCIYGAAALECDVQDDRPTYPGWVMRPGLVQTDSSAVISASCNWMGARGMTVEIACL